MEWTDNTSYSRMDTERKPRVLECRLTPHISFKVHKHIHYGDAWLLTAECVELNQYDLDTEDMEVAKEKAVAIMSQKLKERQSELTDALALLGAGAAVAPVVHAQWVHPEGYAVSNGFICSKCGHREASFHPINPRPGGACVADEHGNFYHPPKINYCPNCGAKMTSDEEAHHG